jgi:hypothetical protein
MGPGLAGALAALALLPALAVMVGRIDGRLAFLDYREPKLLAALVAATALVAVIVWRQGLPRTLAALSRSLRESPDLAVLGLLLGYMVLSRAWVAVPENWWYEARQYALFFLVALLVRDRALREPRVTTFLAAAVCTATGLSVAIGLIQAAGALPWLVPIDPGYGVTFPSLLGYKNPMALAVVAHVFLLPLLALRAAEGITSRWRRRLVLSALAVAFVVECVYVAFLQSRTAYASLAVGLVLLVVVGWRRASPGGAPAGRRRLPLAALAALVGVLVILALPFALRDDLRARVASAKADYLDDWSGSDRATYLLNSVAMAQDRPLGVGLGDWQTHYPVHRRWNAAVAFSETVQPRRAHGDHAQLMAELGLPGLVLWVGFWTVLLRRRFFPRDRRDRRDRQDRERRLHHRLLGVQLVVLLVAMAGDYLLEHPYLKLQFFLLLALGVGPMESARREGEAAAPSARPGVIGLWLARGVVVLLLAGTGWEVWQAAARLHDAGRVRYHHSRWTALRQGGADAEARDEALRRLLRAGDDFERGRGHTKTYFKDHLALAEAALASGRPELAHDLAWESRSS